MKNKIVLLSIIFTVICLTSVAQTVTPTSVGIGTSNPKATLHVVGNMAVREADNARLIEETDSQTGEKIPADQQLFWNKNTGEVETIDDDNFGFPFFVIDYKLICFIKTEEYPWYVAKFFGHPNVSLDVYTDPNLRDKIKDFDTRIPDTYEVFLVFLYPTEYVHPTYKPTSSTDFKRSNNPDYLGIRPVSFSYYDTASSDDIYIFENLDDDEFNGGIGKKFGETKGGYNKQLVPIRKAECFVKDGTWRITIDYISARPPKQYQYPEFNISFTWHVRLLVIDKAFGRSIEDVKEEVRSNADKKPVGSMPNPIQD